MTKKIIEAIQYAAHRHRWQRRKGKSKTPYINHPVDVAKIIMDCGIEDETVLIAALLHDVIEDTVTRTENREYLTREIESKFGKKVVKIVLELTDDKTLLLKQRKKMQIQKTGTISDKAKIIRIADKISNLNDILIDPPKGWIQSRKVKYIEWSREVVEKASGVNACLEKRFENLSIKASQQIKR